jgi:hypothetical protein
MKSLVALFLSVALSSQIFCIAPASAGTMEYHSRGDSKKGALTGDAKVTKVGKLQGDGVASIHENRIDILFNTTDLTQKVPPALSGDTFNTKTATIDNKPGLAGLVFFHGGTEMNKLDVPGSSDIVTTSDGKTLKGRITEATDDHITIATDDGKRTIATDTVRHIKSPHVFRFTIPLSTNEAVDTRSDFRSDATKINFSSTMTTAATLSATESYATGKTCKHCNKAKLALIIIVTGVLIATAIAVPVAVAVGTHHHHSNNSQNQLADTLFLVNAAKAKAAASSTAASVAPKIIKKLILPAPREFLF